MKLTLKSGIAVLISLLLLLSQSGCTYALWTNGQLDAYKEPAPNPNLHLYASKQGQDVLVVYCEYSERKDATRMRVYWLGRNQGRVENNHEPHFARKKAIDDLPAVPVFDSVPDKTCDGFYAVCDTNQQSFTLYSGSRVVGFYDLPVYKDKQGTIEKIALTPVTASADAVVVSGCVGLCVLYGLCQSGYSFQVGK